MQISVIIPTRNRCALLKNTLNSLLFQTIGKDLFEVIVVDNGSTDDTRKVSDEFRDKLTLQYIYEERPGLHRGRHGGLKASHSEILVFADDDIEAFPSWLETILHVFQKDEKIGLVGGKNLPNFETNPPFWISELWNNRSDLGYVLADLSILDFGNEEKEISPFYVFGCNFSIRKSIVIDAGGFHPDGMPFELIKFRGDGETYISQFIENRKVKAYYHPLASVYHLVPTNRMTEEYFLKRRYMQGISDAFTELRNKSSQNLTKPKMLQKIKSLFKIVLGFEQIKLLKELNKTDFERRLLRSYQNGYRYLSKSYQNEKEIKEWIHKENYF
jgi:glycosyltransferase involved in cell wall biosynthesis